MATEAGLSRTPPQQIAGSYDARRALWLQLGLLAFMLLWYGCLLKLSPPPPGAKLDLTFNSMFDHLLHGQFDVDPQVVGTEGFLRNGHTYAYWGIWCALLRIPLWIVGRKSADMTGWSILAAVCLAGLAKVRAVLLLRRHGAQDRAAKQACDLMLAYIVLGGSEIGFLKVSLFQEVVSWAYAFAAVFVYFAIKGLVTRRFDAQTLGWMALCAGLALLTRVTTGAGLMLALGLLLLVAVWRSGAVAEGELRQPWMQAFLSRRVLVPLGILAACMVMAGAVNYFRWGNPLTFADLRLYIMKIKYPDRVLRESMYGMVNVARIPFGLIYYFFPIWAFQTGSGHLLFEPTQMRLFDDVELPPSSFFLTDLLPICLIVFLLMALWRRRLGKSFQISEWAAIAAGLSAPAILMLGYSYMTYRYRMEFYPVIDFLALLGLYAIVSSESVRAKFAQYRVWMEAALIISIAASFAALYFYWTAPFGPVQDFIQRGLAHGRVLIL
jgi:hypothetical protein